MMVEISIKLDSEASVFIAVCDEIGLALEDKSYTTLLKRVKEAVPEMARDNNIDCSAIKIVDKTNIIKERAKTGNREAYLRVLEKVGDEEPREDDICILNDLCEDGCENPMTDEEVAAFVAEVREERRLSQPSDAGKSPDMEGSRFCYLIAKRFDKPGCIALRTESGKELAELVSYLGKKMLDSGIQIFTLSNPETFGEYKPYTFVASKEDFISRVLEM